MKTFAGVCLFSTTLMLTTFATAQPEGGLLRLDSDGDGRVSRDEFRLPERHRKGRGMTRADQDGDGVITRDEMLAAVGEAGAERSERMVSRFDTADSDGNGVLTPQEMADGAFSRLDGDGDGYVTEEEARQMHEQRRARHHDRDRKSEGNEA